MPVSVQFIALRSDAAFDVERRKFEDDFVQMYDAVVAGFNACLDNVRQNGLTIDPSTLVGGMPASFGPVPTAPKSFAAMSDQEHKQYRIDVLQWLKKDRQQMWLTCLERWTYDLIRDVLAISPPADAHTLTIVALPEFFFLDIKDSTPETIIINGITDVKTRFHPFYSPQMENFFLNTDHRAEALQNLTNDKVMLVGGTMMWKEIIDGNCMQDRSINTLPIFFNKKCVYLWDKRYTSEIDGIKKVKWPPAEKRPIVSQRTNGLYRKFCVMSRCPHPRMSIETCEKTVHFGTDICLDYLHEVMEKESWNKPDIHLLIAAGMGDASGRKYAERLFLRCDAHPIGGTFTGAFVKSGDTFSAETPTVRGFFDVYGIKDCI